MGPLYADVLAGDHLPAELIGPAGLTEIRIALAHGQVAGALLGVALGLAPTAREAILALAAALAELLAEVLRLDARAGVVAGPIRVVAGGKVVHVVGACGAVGQIILRQLWDWQSYFRGVWIDW